jgi:hypothetical protein
METKAPWRTNRLSSLFKSPQPSLPRHALRLLVTKNAREVLRLNLRVEQTEIIHAALLQPVRHIPTPFAGLKLPNHRGQFYPCSDLV